MPPQLFVSDGDLSDQRVHGLASVLAVGGLAIARPGLIAARPRVTARPPCLPGRERHTTFLDGLERDPQPLGSMANQTPSAPCFLHCDCW